MRRSRASVSGTVSGKIHDLAEQTTDADILGIDTVFPSHFGMWWAHSGVWMSLMSRLRKMPNSRSRSSRRQGRKTYVEWDIHFHRVYMFHLVTPMGVISWRGTKCVVCSKCDQPRSGELPAEHTFLYEWNPFAYVQAPMECEYLRWAGLERCSIQGQDPIDDGLWSSGKRGVAGFPRRSWKVDNSLWTCDRRFSVIRNGRHDALHPHEGVFKNWCAWHCEGGQGMHDCALFNSETAGGYLKYMEGL